ncbi:Sec1-like protein [Cladorrhinum sp. PSN259]|nr:Sec1-like protein [Cladorrhinum sp. PSN259]
MAPHAGFDTEQVRDKARKDLLHLLESVRGKKNLVIEEKLAGPVGVIVKASTLRDYGVDKIFYLHNKNTDTSQRNVVFIARGESAHNAHAIADQITRLQREAQSPHEFHIFWVPRRTQLSDKVLEEAGVLGDTNVAELPLYFFPLDRDVLSLELDDSFRDLYLAKDPTPVFTLSRALMDIQQKHGLFPRIVGKGDNAKRVADLLGRMRQELLAGEDASEMDKVGLSPSTTIESVIIIDREVDFVTPLLTQLTYEGLIDEVFGIQNNQTSVDTTIVGAPPQSAQGASAAAPASNGQSRKRNIQLEGSDKLFGQLRDANFAIVGGLLNKIARRLQSDYESRHSSKTTAELREFVQKLPGYQAEQQSLKIHTGLAEEIIKYTRTENFNKLLEVQQNLAAGADPSSQFEAIEELIARDTPLPQVLRLLCIYSCISGGIKTRELDHFRRLILQGYGYQHLLTLHNLERLQMFLSRSSPLASMIPMTGSVGAPGTKTNYTYLRKQLRLIVDEVNEHDPNDIAYVYSGYAPLSVRLVQCVLQKQYLLSITRGNGVAGAVGAAGSGAHGWRGFDDAVKHARGQTFDEVQKGEDKAVKARALLSGGGDKKTVFVVFVGGISFSEIAALRFIAKQEEERRNIIICTTSIISGNRMMEAAVEKESFEKAKPAQATTTSSRGRGGKVVGAGKRPVKSSAESDSRRSSRISLASAKPLSPAASIVSDPESAHRMTHLGPESVIEEEIAPEIVVWTEDMDTMSVDTPESPPPALDVPPETIPSERVPIQPVISDVPPDEMEDIVESPLPPSSARQSPPPSPSAPLSQQISSDEPLSSPPEGLLSGIKDEEEGPSQSSGLSVVSEHSAASSNPSSASSKATTPIDVDSSKEAFPPAAAPVPVPAVLRPSQGGVTVPRRKHDVRPKVSIPQDIPITEYAMQCIAGAEASRLNPYALHQDEYMMLRDHISHTQVTTYLNIRNGILRLWVRNPQIAVTRDEAVGCAKDSRWFDVASVCFDWLVRRGYINFGCVEQYSRRFRELGEEPPRVIVLEGRNRVGGRVYSRAFTTRPKQIPDHFQGKRFTAEMGGMIITGFDRGNPINILLRGQLGLPYHQLTPDTTLYDSNGKPVDLERDQLVENLYNDCLDRVSEYKFKQPTSKLIEGNRDLIDEGKDSSAETHKTIRQVEEATAAQPHAPSVSEQNMAPQVNLVPISSDRATGKVHTEPGTPGALKAAHKARMIGWTLKQGVSEDADLNIEPATKEEGATLGSVTDKVIHQYRDLVDLTAQDLRLMNWHIANLEYSNATNYNQLSLQGWDIDAGNEWEGSHTMVIGGYQDVPRGLVNLPTPLDLRQKSPVKNVIYNSESEIGPAMVECEDGFKVEADYIVNTIPLGVLKHGNVEFHPPLPSWKSETISRLGFGVLNKVILVYKQPFWDESRDIFGVLRTPTNRNSLDQKDYASQRGRFFQWFNISKTSGLPVLLALMAGDAGFDTEQTCNDDLVREATEILRSVFGSRVPNPVEAIVTRWASDKFARGSYSSAGPNMKADDYDTMARPVGNLFFAGEHTCGTHPATVHGAYLSGLRAASEVLDSMLGPIDIPTPLIIPKDSSLKRKHSSSEKEEDPVKARLEQHEIAVWDHIVKEIGYAPIQPAKPATNAYIFFSKDNYDSARKKLEAARRPGKGKASANEVRVMSAKMWRDADEGVRKPYMEMAEEQKRNYAKAMEEWKIVVAEWEKKAIEERKKYEEENPPPASTSGGDEVEAKRRKGRVVESYAEPESGDELEAVEEEEEKDEEDEEDEEQQQGEDEDVEMIGV